MAFAFVSGSQALGALTDDGSVAYAQNVGSNTLLAALFAYDSRTVSVVGITDTRTNTWALAYRHVHATQAAGVEIWYAYCPTGGANTVSIDMSGAAGIAVVVVEFSGFTGGALKDQSDGADTDSETTVTCGSITTTKADSVALACIRFPTAFSITGRADGFNALTGTSRSDRQYKISSALESLDGNVTCAAPEIAAACIANFYAPTTAKPWYAYAQQ